MPPDTLSVKQAMESTQTPFGPFYGDQFRIVQPSWSDRLGITGGPFGDVPRIEQNVLRNPQMVSSIIRRMLQQLRQSAPNPQDDWGRGR